VHATDLHPLRLLIPETSAVVLIEWLPGVVMCRMEIEQTATVSREKPFVNRTGNEVGTDLLDREGLDADRLSAIKEDVWTIGI
jgi:hypothetical protein